ncbi:hypothetical protein ACS0TY_007651 [Phlomoides rotata]
MCCSAYVKKLKKKLAKLNVECVEINPEKSLVSIRGKVDPNLVLKTVARTGKQAEIVRFDSESPHNKDPEHHHRHCCCNNRNREDEEDHVKSSHTHNHRHSCFQNKYEEEEEEHHKCEDYDEWIRRDSCSRKPAWMRSTRGGLPRESSSFFGRFSGYAGGPAAWAPPWWSMEEPPAWFYPRRPVEEPPTEYGFREEPHWPGFDQYGHYENSRGCFIM